MIEGDKKIVENRYDFVLVFDVKDGNPNGDPDAGNLPRIDAETGQGLVTDVSLKRKVRNYVELTMAEKQYYKIFIREKGILNDTIEETYKQTGLSHIIKDPKATKNADRYAKPKHEEIDKAKKYLLENFYDIRTFGAVMTTGANAGQVRGPAQLTFARSIDRVVTSEHSITRMAVTSKEESEKQSGDNRTMGRKFTIPYALYRAHGFISAPLASQTGFSENDLNIFWEALEKMFDHDRSAARGLMCTRKLIIFKHDSKMGNSQAQKLFDLVSINRKDENKPPRDFTDYTISIAKNQIPNGVHLIERPS